VVTSVTKEVVRMIGLNRLGNAALIAVTLAGGAPAPTTLILWPGYTIELPANHCVSLSRGPDFDTLSFRDRSVPKAPPLAGLYAGHNPEELKCAEPTSREWDANGLHFKSVRGSDGCAEFQIEDSKQPERGFLHVWFGPGAKDHPQLAEGLVASVKPAKLPVYRSDDLPFCK